MRRRTGPSASPLRAERDTQGDLRARVAPADRLLGAFFESDVQESVAVAHEIADGMARVAAGEIPRFEWSGNVHSLVVTRGRVRLTDEVAAAAPTHRSSPARFRAALARWLEAIEALEAIEGAASADTSDQ